MPIYEYACDKCGEVIEVTQKMTDAPLSVHNGDSDCGGNLRKLMSSNSFHLKGTGWYKTDYASKSPSGGGGAAKSGAGEKSDSPPADGGGGAAKDTGGEKAASSGDSGGATSTASASAPSAS